MGQVKRSLDRAADPLITEGMPARRAQLAQSSAGNRTQAVCRAERLLHMDSTQARPGLKGIRVCLWCGGEMLGKKASALTCSVDCNHARLAARRKAEKWVGVDPERVCEQCGQSMKSKRPHARFCSRVCKAAAAQDRYRDAGILQVRDLARYEREGDKRREYAKNYLQDNPERMRAIRLRRKGRIRASSFRFTEKEWKRLVNRYRGCCAYCGEQCSELQREHVIPLARGGTHGIGNIVPACSRCNYAKKDKLLIEWRSKCRTVEGS